MRAERERLRHVTELAEGVAAAGEALAPDEGEGASGLVALAERALSPLERLAPELERAGNELRDAELRLRETASELRGSLPRSRPSPTGSTGRVGARPDRRRKSAAFAARPTRSCWARAAEARAELEALDGGADPAAAAAQAVADGGGAGRALAGELRAARRSGRRALRNRGRSRSFAASAWARASSGSSCASASRPRRVPTRSRSYSPQHRPAVRAGRRDRLGRRALPHRTRDRSVGGGETLVFDEIDAGIGGQTAHAVGETLRAWPAGPRWSRSPTCLRSRALADRHFRVERSRRSHAHDDRAARGRGAT